MLVDLEISRYSPGTAGRYLVHKYLILPVPDDVKAKSSTRESGVAYR
jgi:hypothetical protein